MIADGIKKWLEECPYITLLDMSQVQKDAEGLYKQAAVTVTKLSDGSEIHLENWYVLFQRDAQLEKERMDANETIEQFEDWVYRQELAESYPDIGYTVTEVGTSNGYYLMSAENNEAVYQATLQVEYIKE